jgi:TolA-binding protein
MAAMESWRWLALLSLAATCPIDAGCMFITTKREGDLLRQELGGLKSRLEQSEKQRQEMDKSARDLSELREMLPKARDLLARSSARVGAKLDQLESLLSKLQGRVESLEADQGSGGKAVQSLKTQVGQMTELQERIRAEVTKLMVEVRRAAPEPKTANELFARATIARLSGRYPEARQDYEGLIQKFPTDPRVEASYLLVAQTYYEAYDFRAAAISVARQLKAFPEGKHSNAGRLLSARSHVELKKCGVAMRILTRLLQAAPGTEEAPQAQTLLNHLRRVQRVARYCTPGA